MHLEALESRTLLAGDTGSFASASFSFEGGGPSFRQSITIQFSRPLTAPPTSDKFQIIDLITHSRQTATLSFVDAKTVILTPQAQNRFPDGDYRLILDKTDFPDAAAPESFDYHFDFFTLTGDLDRDRAVSINDFIQLASNLGKSNPAWSDGDINYDGQVSIADFTLLNQNFGKSLAPSPNSLHLNAGGPAFADSLARTFEPSADFLRGTAHQTPYDIPYFDDDTLFNTYIEGNDFSFSRPIANGRYTLFLNFAEPIFDQIGQRIFDVFANQRLIIDDFDLMQRAGFQTPITRAFPIQIANNSLDLAFRGVVGDAMVSSIMLLPTDVPALVKPYTPACASDSALISQSSSNLFQLGQGIFLYRDDHKGRFPPDLPSLYHEEDYAFDSFFNPRTSTQMPRGELTFEEQTALIAATDDYLSLLAGKNGQTPEDAPLAYENPDRTVGPISILFNNGLVQTFTRADASVILGIPINDPSDPPAPRDFSNCNPDALVTASSGNMKRIANALFRYANYNRNIFPPDLGTLYRAESQMVSLSDFLNPRLGSGTPPTGMPIDDAAAWINAHSDYLYYGKGRRGWDAPMVLLSENPDQFTNGINLVFADGSIPFRESPWAIETIRRSVAQFPNTELRVAPPGTSATTLTSLPIADPTPSKPHRRHLHHPFAF